VVKPVRAPGVSVERASDGQVSAAAGVIGRNPWIGTLVRDEGAKRPRSGRLTGVTYRAERHPELHLYLVTGDGW